MADLGPVPWPPAVIRTERLLLREPGARDRAAVIELFASPEVGAHVGGPRAREQLELAVPETPTRRRGLFIVEADDALIGFITFNRRDADRPGHLGPDEQEVELSYLFLPRAWGFGYATEACAAALAWCADALPGEPVVLCTHAANLSSMNVAAKLGFVEVGRFEEYEAERWFGVWTSCEAPPAPSIEVVLAADRDASTARLADLKRQFERTVEASLDSNADDEHDPEGATIAYERAQLSALDRADPAPAGGSGECVRPSAGGPVSRL